MSRVNKYASIKGFGGGQVLKAFMPNIVMIDFADEEKSKHIFELNTIPFTFLVTALGDYAHVQKTYAICMKYLSTLPKRCKFEHMPPY
jgi:hypothetical protein